jgi:hypothetical protein
VNPLAAKLREEEEVVVEEEEALVAAMSRDPTCRSRSCCNLVVPAGRIMSFLTMKQALFTSC